MQTITPFLWFDNCAEQAVDFYLGVFPRAELLRVMGGSGDCVSGLVFRVLDQELIAFNGGPHFRFTPAVSLFVRCDTQEEVDLVWDRMTAEGKASRCGWLTDKFGLSWQIVPAALGDMLQDKDPERAGRVMQAMLGMVRLDLAALRAAFDGA